MIDEKIICAGFGGQGVMSMGQLLAYAGMLEDRHVTWMPSYGPEMRGGTAYCCVMISDAPVGSPLITNDAGCAVVMNLPSLRKFEKTVIPGGYLLVNSSMTAEKSDRCDLYDYYIPADELAMECGNRRTANMIMLGAYLEITRAVQPENVVEAFRKVFGAKAERLLPQNTVALHKGMEYAAGHAPLHATHVTPDSYLRAGEAAL
jgi:2-oxoglutarate ferredoxin oxidoreductase subunit gamma